MNEISKKMNEKLTGDTAFDPDEYIYLYHVVIRAADYVKWVYQQCPCGVSSDRTGVNPHDHVGGIDMRDEELSDDVDLGIEDDESPFHIEMEKTRALSK